jgi:hypothetical protein
MVQVDERWDRLKLVKAAGWKTPPAHPDVEPAHEALLLREAFREAARSPELDQRPAELRAWLAEAEKDAGELETALSAASNNGEVKSAPAEQAFARSAAACTRCHAKYRNVPAK